MMFKHEQNKAIKVFSQLYVGVQKTPDDGSAPLAFATPYETTAAGLKRQETVLNWLGGDTERVIENGSYVYENGRMKTIPAVRDLRVLENTLRSGFKITDNVKRVYWGGGNVVFRVQDPYGYELEIESGNLMALLQIVGIEKGGVIPGNCIWGRDGSKNILLHESSVEYQESVKAAESLKKPKALGQSSKVIGSTYRLQDGSFGQYLGKMYIVSSEGGERGRSIRTQFAEQFAGFKLRGTLKCHLTERKLRQDFEQFEVVLLGNESDTSETNSQVRLYKKAPLTECLEAGTLDAAEAERIANRGYITRASGSGRYYTNELLTIKKPEVAEFVASPMSTQEFAECHASLKNQLATEEQWDGKRQYTIKKALDDEFNVLRVQRAGEEMFFGYGSELHAESLLEARELRQQLRDLFKADPGLAKITVCAPRGVSQTQTGLAVVLRSMHAVQDSYISFGEEQVQTALHVLPTFKSPEEALASFDAEFKAGNLFRIGIKVK